MIVVKIMGGLGNQLFQYALGRHLAIKNNTELKLDTTSFEDIEHRPFGLDKLTTNYTKAETKEIPYLVRMPPHNRFLILWSRIFGSKIKIKKEKHFHFDSEVVEYKDDFYLYGYWQNEKYFKDIKHIILAEFKFNLNFSSKIIDISIDIGNFDSVSLHVRRGDYVGNIYYQILDLSYYELALEKITINLKKPKIYIFSDDIDWCKKNLNLKYLHFFVSENKDWEDLFLMTRCNHHIIANSSFSWWGAYLGKNKNKLVIGPKKWFAEIMGHNTNDILPKDWLKI